MAYPWTSDGLPFNCAYCVSNRMSDGKVRLRSVENVITIVKRLVSDTRRQISRFEHDILTLNRDGCFSCVMS